MKFSAANFSECRVIEAKRSKKKNQKMFAKMFNVLVVLILSVMASVHSLDTPTTDPTPAYQSTPPAGTEPTVTATISTKSTTTTTPLIEQNEQPEVQPCSGLFRFGIKCQKSSTAPILTGSNSRISSLLFNLTNKMISPQSINGKFCLITEGGDHFLKFAGV